MTFINIQGSTKFDAAKVKLQSDGSNPPPPPPPPSPYYDLQVTDLQDGTAQITVTVTDSQLGSVYILDETSPFDIATINLTNGAGSYNAVYSSGVGVFSIVLRSGVGGGGDALTSSVEATVTQAGGGGGGGTPSDGWDAGSSIYYIGGQATSLDQSGYGDFNGVHYSAYPTAYEGVDGSTWYNAGVAGAGNDGFRQYDDTGALTNGMFGGRYYQIGVDISVDNGWDPNRGYYYVEGVEAPPLNQSGDGDWNGKTYQGGLLLNGQKSGTPDIYVQGVYSYTMVENGWDSNREHYYISNIETTLDNMGDGVWGSYFYVAGSQQGYSPFSGYVNMRSTYYINDTSTGLDMMGTGVFNNSFYYNGQSVVSTGTWNGYYYVNGVAVVDTGDYGGLRYLNGAPLTGVYNGSYYVNGTAVVASGTYNGGYYENGDLKVTTGMYAGYYYMDGVQTNLNSNGTGWYSSYYYENGIRYTGTSANSNDGGNNWYFVDGAPVISEGYYIGLYYIGGQPANGWYTPMGQELSINFIDGVAQA